MDDLPRLLTRGGAFVDQAKQRLISACPRQCNSLVIARCAQAYQLGSTHISSILRPSPYNVYKGQLIAVGLSKTMTLLVDLGGDHLVLNHVL